MSSSPRRRKSGLIFINSRKNKLLFTFNQNSRLCGNNGALRASCFILDFAKVSTAAMFSGCLNGAEKSVWFAAQRE